MTGGGVAKGYSVIDVKLQDNEMKFHFQKNYSDDTPNIVSYGDVRMRDQKSESIKVESNTNEKIITYILSGYSFTSWFKQNNKWYFQMAK